MNKLLKILIIFIILSLFATGCTGINALPSKLSLENSIREIILSKGDNYNFLNDDAYIEHMEDLVTKLTNNENPKLNINYALGSLTKGHIPELAVFNEKNPDDINDEGSLDIYKFDGSKYSLLDEISMSFDSSNHEMKIGRISQDQSGLLVNNNIGSNSRLTYGFILENGKLKSILNQEKISLISVYAENKIIDIDGDGILNFSIVTVDPETKDTSLEDSDKMTLWYRWNGRDSVDLVKVERKDYSQKPSNKRVFNQAEYLITNDFENSLNYIIDNKNKLSKYDNTVLLKSYINKLNELVLERGIEVNNLFYNYEKEQEVNLLSGNRSDNIENLNSIEYLSREKVLQNNKEIKNHLINNINLGFKLNAKENIYLYLIDYNKFVDLFDGHISNEYMHYLKILHLDSNGATKENGNPEIPKNQLVEKILLAESFKSIYPFSDFLTEVDNLYDNYIRLYFFGPKDNPNYDPNTNIIKKDTLEEFQQGIDTYELTNFSHIISDFMDWLKENNNIVDDEIRQKLDNRLN